MIPVDDELAEWIAWRQEQSGDAWAPRALFVNPLSRERYLRNLDRRLTANKLREVWNAAAERVGVRVRLYEGCKHSSATAWRSRGMSFEHVRRTLRHRDLRMQADAQLLGTLAYRWLLSFCDPLLSDLEKVAAIVPSANGVLHA